MSPEPLPPLREASQALCCLHLAAPVPCQSAPGVAPTLSPWDHSQWPVSWSSDEGREGILKKFTEAGLTLGRVLGEPPSGARAPRGDAGFPCKEPGWRSRTWESRIWALGKWRQTEEQGALTPPHTGDTSLRHRSGPGPWQGPAFPSFGSLDLGGGGLQLGSRAVKAGLDATRGPGLLDREGGR